MNKVFLKSSRTNNFLSFLFESSKKVVESLLFLFVMLIGCVIFINGQKVKHNSADRKIQSEILSVIDRLAEAGIKRDAATIEKLYSDDYFHTNADGSMMTKADVVSTYRLVSGATIKTNRHSDEKFQIGKNTAICNARIFYQGEFEGQSFERYYRVTYFLKKSKGIWQITASHASLISN